MPVTITAKQVIAVRLAPDPGSSRAAPMPLHFEIYKRTPTNWNQPIRNACVQSGTLPPGGIHWFTLRLTAGASASIVASKPRWPNRYSPLSALLLGDPTALDNELPPIPPSLPPTTYKPMEATFSVNQNYQVSSSDPAGGVSTVVSINGFDPDDDYWLALLLPAGSGGEILTSGFANPIQAP